MIVLPMGSFLMGGPPGESRLTRHIRGRPLFRPVTPEDPYIAHFEGPVHEVTIDIPIAMAVNELTFDDWNACLTDGGCGGYEPSTEVLVVDGPSRKLGGRHPLINVSIDDAQLYLDWINAKVGAEVYRLPTEAEWEYAARAGTQSPFAQGDDLTTDQANLNAHVTIEMLGEDRPDFTQRGYPVPVDELDAANAWGLRHTCPRTSGSQRSHVGRIVTLVGHFRVST